MYTYVDFNPACWANNIRTNTAGGKYTLKWDAAPACGFLLFKCDPGKDIEDRMDDLCKILTDMNFIGSNDYTEIDKGIFVKTLPVGRKEVIVSDSGRYYVFACKEENGVYKVYAPPTGGMGEYYTDVIVKLEMHITVGEYKEEIVEGLFRRRTVFKPSGYYYVRFSDDLDVTRYIDGDVYYVAHGVRIPITRAMIEQNEIYIKTDIRPELETDKDFLEVIER